jgi:hypothetical protein
VQGLKDLQLLGERFGLPEPLVAISVQGLKDLQRRGADGGLIPPPRGNICARIRRLATSPLWTASRLPSRVAISATASRPSAPGSVIGFLSIGRHLPSAALA